MLLSTTGGPICDAIRTLHVLEFEYRGHHRVVAPYVHGYTALGREMLRAIQLRGSSEKGGFGFGKLWKVSDMHAVRVTQESFIPDDPNYNPDDSTIVRVHCRVSRA